MGHLNKEHTAIVLGLSICGLGVIRSLGIKGIKVCGFDYDREGRDGFHSKYVKAGICPHPVYQPEKLIEFFSKNFANENNKPILFPTCDEFVKFISDYRDKLEKYFIFNISAKEIIDSIIDKKIQYEFAEKSGVNIADTYYPESIEDVYNLQKILKYPLIIKGRYSFKWREVVGGTLKGFKVNDRDELIEKCNGIFKSKVSIIIQRVILGPNTNHFKFCAYINKEGEILAKFTLRKIRQYPVEFGVGSCVESVEYKELEEIGIKFFKGINYRGVGSAEFKLDSEDSRLKLIELNPRYWMQNELASYCGLNFALTQYLDLSAQESPATESFRVGVRWVDPIQDFKSFAQQNQASPFQFFRWLKYIAKCRVFSVFCWHDMKSFMVSLNYGLKLFKAPIFLIKEKKRYIKNKA